MTKKRSAGLLGILMFLPLAASAGDLPSLAQVLATVEPNPTHAVIIPVAHTVAAAQAQMLAPATVDIVGDSDGGMASMVHGQPRGAKVDLMIINATLVAQYRDLNGSAINYTFPRVIVGNTSEDGADIYFQQGSQKVIIGHIHIIKYDHEICHSEDGPAAPCDIPVEEPVLNAGYTLKYGYGGTIDAGTGADRAFVNVEIVSAQQAQSGSSAPVVIFATPKNGPMFVSIVGGEPSGAYAYLTVQGDKLGAEYVTSPHEDGISASFVFPDVDVAYDEILYHGTVIGRIEGKGNPNLPYPAPVLNDGYTLKFTYGGTIGAGGNDGDKDFVIVEIVSASH